MGEKIWLTDSKAVLFLFIMNADTDTLKESKIVARAYISEPTKDKARNHAVANGCGLSKEEFEAMWTAIDCYVDADDVI